jgi:hypothetical protein
MVIEMLDFFMCKHKNAEEEIINKVLTQVLHRFPTEKDWQDCEIQEKIGEPHSYFLLHNNKKLGIIQKKVEEKDFVWTLIITFNPVSDLN